MKLRALLTKGEEIRFISHLDYAALIERAIRRAKLPVAYSEGFNPHMKFSFASALAVGVTSEAEVMDVELSRPVAQPEAWDRLAAALPPGVRLLRLAAYEGKAKSLMAAVDRAEYRVRVPYVGAEEEARRSVDAFFAAPEVLYRRVLPKKTREVDAKAYLKGIRVEKEGGCLLLFLAIAVTPEGSLKPGEAIGLLAHDFGLAVEPREAEICRTALLSGGKDLFALIES